MDDMRDAADSDGASDAMLAWIATQWATLAAIAWRGYVTAGRGLVVLDGPWDGQVTVGYLTAAAAQAAGAPWPPTLRTATQAYTPATDILFLIQQDTVGTVLRMRAARHQVPPRQAAQAAGAPLVLAA